MKQRDRYTQDEFLRLIEAVEDQGGQYLDEHCKPVRAFDFTGDVPLKERDKALSYCGQPSLFDVPYEDEHGGQGKIKVCAVDDGMGMWPRFRDQVNG